MEKSLVKGMIDLYAKTKQVDRISYDLPIDLLGFSRFFCIPDMA